MHRCQRLGFFGLRLAPGLRLVRVTKDLHDRVKQRGGGGRLDQHRVCAQGIGLSFIVVFTRQQQDDRQILQLRNTPDLADDLQPVQTVRHALVQHQQVKMIAAGWRVQQPAERLAGRTGSFDLEGQGSQDGFDKTQGLGVVIHSQHAQAAQVRRDRQAAGARPGLELDRQAEAEGAALILAALDPDLAAHHTHQALADDQPQAGAAEFAAGGGIDLAESLEQAGKFLGFHANPGIAHRKFQGQAVVMVLDHFNLDHHFAGLGELDRVAHQVEQHLAQAARVADDPARHIRRGVEDQLQAFFLCAQRDQVGQAVQNVIQVEVNRLDLQLAGFNLGKIEDIVDDLQQRLAGGGDAPHVIALFFIQVGLQHQVRQPQHAAHGGADLVAHDGQEITLGAVGIIGLIAGLFQLGGAFLHQGFQVIAVAQQLGLGRHGCRWPGASPGPPG